MTEDESDALELVGLHVDSHLEHREAPAKSATKDRELNLRERELRLSEEEFAAKRRDADRDFSLRESEHQLRKADAARSRWTNPLVLVIAGAALAAASNGYIAARNGQTQFESAARHSYKLFSRNIRCDQ